MLSGERKLATLLFADLSGYTEMARRLDPEDVVSVVDPVMRDLQRVAEAHGGTVLMTAGDGVLCAFGVPLVREDDALRAVRAAGEMRSLAEVAAGTEGVHIGIASGEILITPDGSPRGWGITGLCVALATRLSDLAGDGEILADEVCRQLAGPSARWGPVRASQVQGMGDRPVMVAQLLGLDDSPSPRAREPLVARQVELARLDELLTRVTAEQRSFVVSVQGDAGIGKSRLLEAWLDRHPEITAITGQCHSYGASRPLAGLLDAVLDHLRLRGLLTHEGLLGLLSAQTEAHALVSRLLAIAAAEQGPAAEDVGSVLAHALRCVLEALTQESPCVLVVEDAHWAGEDVLAFLTDLHGRHLPVRLLVVAVQRDGPGWEAMPTLEPLPDWACRQLIEQRLPRAPDALVSALLERTGGNPLYLQESLNLLEEGIGGKGGQSQLPPSVRALLAARLDSLDPEAKEIALFASAGADLVWADHLARLTGAQPDEALRTLVARGILIAVTSGGYRFGHRLFQEVAYSALTRSRRVWLHLSYLDLLEDESPAVRAFHAESAWQHLAAEAPERGAVATRALTELHALGETLFAWQATGARAVFVRAEAVMDDVPNASDGAVTAALATYAQVLIDLGDLLEALAVAQRARDKATDAHSEAASRLALGHALARLGRMGEARLEVQPLLGRDEPGLRGRALKVLAETWRFESEHRFYELLEEAFEALEQAGDTRGQGEIARLLAYLLSVSADGAFQRWFDRASAMLSLDDLRGRALMVRTACFAAGGRADWPGVVKLAEEALQLGLRAGVLDVVVDATLAAITGRTYLGDTKGALAFRTELVASELPPRARLAMGCASALALLRDGQPENAREELLSASSLAEEFGGAGRVLHRHAQAEVLLDGGWPGAARLAALEGLQAAEAANASLIAVQLRLLLCRIGQALGASMDDETARAQADADRLGAGPLAELASVLARDSAELPAEGVEARAIWFENAAMRATDDDEARANWQRAHDEWSRLGHTIWPQRALKARDLLPRTLQELAAIPLEPLMDLTALPSDA